MPSREELQKISRTRFEEVKILHKNDLFDGAKYLSGYVVETALKARICKILEIDYPDSGEISKSFLTHKFDILVKLGGLQQNLDEELNKNITFKTNWSLATSWNESFRYQSIGSFSKTDIEDLIKALDDETDGILNWIEKRW